MPMSRLPRTPIIGVAVIAFLALTACAGGGTGPATADTPSSGFKAGVLNKDYSGTTLQVALPPWGQMPPAQLGKFSSATGIKVSMQSLDFDALHDKLVTAGAANQAVADVVEMDWSWVGQFGAAGWMTPLKDWLPASTISKAIGASAFNAKGNQIALPYSLDFRGSIVNMTLLKKAGIDTAPTTYAELIQAAQQLKAKGVTKYPVGLPLSIKEGTSTPWYALVRAAGGSILKANGDLEFKSSGIGAGALDLIHRLYSDGLIDKGSVGLSDTDVTNQFAAGQSAILLSAGPGALSTFADKKQSKVSGDDVVLTPVPAASASNNRAAIGLEEGMGIPKASKAKAAAAMFIYWWTQQEQYATAYSTPAMGLLPPNEQTLTSLVDSGKLLGGKAIVRIAKTIAPVIDGGAPVWYPKFSNTVASTVQSAAVGNESAQAGIDALVKQVRALKNQ